MLSNYFILKECIFRIIVIMGGRWCYEAERVLYWGGEWGIGYLGLFLVWLDG